MAYYGASPVVFESVSAVTLTPSVGLGTRRIENDNEYVYIYNAANSNIDKGYTVNAKSVATPYSVTVTSTTQVMVPVGVILHATLTTAQYGWALVRGYGTVKAASAVAVGEPLYLGVDGNLVTPSTMAGWFGPCVGQALAAAVSTTSGTALAYVRCFG
jgi:hypothetical protein